MDKLQRKGKAFFLPFALFLFSSPMCSFASSGTEGAAFLDIPVGAGPAAVGSAYTALAKDAYTATWNPGGLGFLESTQFSGQHLAYLDTIHYEYLSFAVPLPRTSSCTSPDECPGSALGGSIQYLGSGDVSGTDNFGAPTGSFSSHYASYNLAYGRAFNDQLSLGLTGKMINAKIDNVSANAYAVDLGSMYKLTHHLTLASTLTNLGSKLTFLNQGDPLPLAFHVGAVYQPTHQWLLTTEGVYPRTGLASFHLGGEWRPLELLSIRAGYRTDTVKELSPIAGFSAGLGVDVWGQELSYAWVPYGDLGDTHYVSLVMKFGEVQRAKRNLIQFQHIKTHRTANANGTEELTPDSQQLMELFEQTKDRVAKQGNGAVQDHEQR